MRIFLVVVVLTASVAATFGIENCSMPINKCIDSNVPKTCYCPTLGKNITFGTHRGYFEIFDPTNGEPLCPPSIEVELAQEMKKLLNNSIQGELLKVDTTYVPKGAIVTLVAAIYDAVLFSILVVRFGKQNREKQSATYEIELKRQRSVMRRPNYVSIIKQQPAAPPAVAVQNDEYEVPSKLPAMPSVPPSC